MSLNGNLKKSKLKLSASIIALTASLGVFGDAMGMEVNNYEKAGYAENIHKDTTRLLSLDGGGIRGIIEIYQLAVLEKVTGKQCYELFDVFAGTSTGGIIAGALSFGLKAETILRLYMKCGPEIFKKGFNNHVDTKGILGTQFYASFLEGILQELTQTDDGFCKFDNTIPGNLKKRVFLTGYDMSEKKGLLFDSQDSGVQENDLAAVLRVTSAAPTYFDPATCIYHGKKLTNCVDGGLYVNNPTSVVVDFLINENIQEIKMLKKEKKHQKLDVFSFGTGNTSAIPCDIDFTNKSALYTWTPSLLEALFNSSAITTDKIVNNMFERDSFDMPQRLAVVNKPYRNQPELTDKRTHEMSNTDLTTTGLLLGEGSGQIHKNKIDELLTSLGFFGEDYGHNKILDCDKMLKLELDRIDVKNGSTRLYFYGLINDYVLHEGTINKGVYPSKLMFGGKPLYKNSNLVLDDFTSVELKEISVWLGKFIEFTRLHDSDKSKTSKVLAGVKSITPGFLGYYLYSEPEGRHSMLEMELQSVLNAIENRITDIKINKNNDF